ncbi:MAG: MATE family efflux transporter [Clostridia bacterium]|nr:MATE family efflux transporter [Clostridia bacterium]
MSIRRLRDKFIGDKAFYAMVLGVAVPIMIQNGITSFVSMLDNIMVGQMGTEPMSGVAIVNQLFFVFNLCIFGATSGAGIFGAQFAGSGNTEGLRSTTQFKLIVGALIFFAGLAVYRLGGESLVRLYLHDGSESADIEATLAHAMDYRSVMLWGLLPFVLAQVYSSTLRETGQTVVPMIAGISAVMVNLALNYALIFGHFGFPAMGVRGAALATVISRFVELAIIATYAHAHTAKYPFMARLYTHWRIPARLAKQITIQGMPLMLNEMLWSTGMTILNQCYSIRGLDGVAAINISSTIFNLFGVVFMALGASVGIIVGQKLGAGEMEEARDADNKLIVFSVASCLVMGGVLIAVAPLFPEIYNTSDSVRAIATSLIRMNACYMPLHAFANASYFTLRSGGKSGITFVFDSGFTWVIQIPVALALSRLTSLPIVPLYAICAGLDILKCVLGFVLVKQGKWLNNLTAS